MEKIIDIEALSKMPITAEFTKLIFGIDVDTTKVRKEKGEKVLTFKYTDFWSGHYYFLIGSDGSIGRQVINGDKRIDADIIPRTFQIVRYIDNYLNSLKTTDINFGIMMPLDIVRNLDGSPRVPRPERIDDI
jgi:hypothetical protein